MGKSQDNINERSARACRLRALFSPAELLNDDGSINQNYFRPENTGGTSQKWTNDDDLQLVEAFKEVPVGDWLDIVDRFLPSWDVQEVREQSAKLLALLGLEDSYAGQLTEQQVNDMKSGLKQLHVQQRGTPLTSPVKQS